MKTKLASAVFALTALHSGVASALGLGDLSLDSALNQPFKATIPLNDVGGLNPDQILIKIADNDAFKKAGVDRNQFLSKLDFSIEVNSNGSGQVVITSRETVVEPYLDFIVEARWPSGRILREYTVLLDLPSFSDAPSSRVTAPVTAAKPAQPEMVDEFPTMDDMTAEPTTGGAVTSVAAPTPVAPKTAQPTPTASSASPAETPDSYRVKNHDTMWKVAEQLRPSVYVSTQQTMLALLKKNPSAFIDGNVNRVKAGSLLQVPSEQEAVQTEQREAVMEIRRQDELWRDAKSNRVASAAAAPEVAAPQLTGGSVDAPEEAPSTEATFSISSGGDDSGDDSDTAQLKDSLAKAESDAEQSRLESSALQQRVLAMETQIAKMQALIKLKNDQLAALQAGVSSGTGSEEEQALKAEIDAAKGQVDAATDEMSQSGMVPGEATSALDADDSSTPVMPMDSVPMDGMAQADGEMMGSASNLDDAAPTDESVAPEQSTPDQSAAEQSAPEQSVPAASEQTAGAPWYEGPAKYLVAVLALLALIAVWVRKRANAAAAQDDLSAFDDQDVDNVTDTAYAGESTDYDGEAQVATEFSDEDAQAVDAALGLVDTDDVDSDSAPAPVQPQMGDPVAEAEIYAAYGRYDQAESLLTSALQQDPDNNAVRVKLIEIYLETRNRSGFDLAFAELKQSGDSAAVDHVKESMSALEGVSDWLRDEDSTNSGPADNSFSDTGFSPVSGGDVEFELDDELDGADELAFTDSRDSFPADTASADTAPVSISNEADELASLDDDLADLDFDLGMEESEEPGYVRGDEELGYHPVGDASAEVSADISPDDLSLDGLGPELSSAETDQSASLDSDNFAGDLTFDLGGSDELSADDLGSVELESRELDSPGLDNLELESPELDSSELDSPDPDSPDLGASSASAGDDSDSAEPSWLGGDLDSDLEADLGASSEPQAQPSDTLDVDAGMDLKDLAFDEFDADSNAADEAGLMDEEDHVGTKLSLARAYVEMGDGESARDILEEVLLEGSEEQKLDAQELLSQL